MLETWYLVEEDEEDGICLWASFFFVEGEKYVQMQYKTKSGKRIGEKQEYSVEKIRTLEKALEKLEESCSV
jgi:hypothetical protein